MDSAIQGNRKFPAYTTKQLQDMLATCEPTHRQAIEQEIADRLSGKSKVLRLPQLLK